MNRQQRDLHWPLSQFPLPEKAGDFFDRFQGAFAVYSKSVKKIYTEYTAFVVSDHQPLLVIQPDMHKHTAMFHDIREEAVFRTSVILYEEQGEKKLSGVLAGINTRKSFPIAEGLYRLFTGEFIEGAFLPIVAYGDLRTLAGQTQPLLQLHGLKIEHMGYLSDFQINDIVEGLKENLIARLPQAAGIQ